MSAGVVHDDDRKLRKILREVAKLRGATVTIGVHGTGGTYPDGQTVAEVATIHEFGAGRIPERSFLRSTVDGNPKPMIEAQKSAANVCRDLISARQCAERIGLVTVGAVKETILSGIAPPLSQQTIQSRMKKGEHGGGLASKAGATTPLVDTGQLIGSITHEVTGARGWGRASAGTKAGIAGAE